MNNILKNNLKILEQYQPYVFQKLMLFIEGKYKPQNNLIERILLAQQDDLIINVLVVCNQKEYLLCNHEDPISESYQWIDKYIDPSNKADIVFGMGLGFHIEVLLTGFKNRKVIVIEPNIELFYQILQVRNLELILKNSELLVDEDVDNILYRIQGLFWDTEKGGIQCQPFKVYSDMFGSLWDELSSKFVKQAENFAVDISTRRYFGELWAYNNIKNLEKIKDTSNAGGLVGKFEGVPAVLVSAGPSLSKNIHLLKELKNKCIIMAAGTAVNILEQNGITPHFMVGIDASEGEAERHRKVKSNEIYFIYSNQVATGSVEGYSGPKFLMNYPVDVYSTEFMNSAGIQSEMFLSGPSVSNTCMDILFKMGCNPIILTGQDLAYTDGKMYAGDETGSLTEKIKNLESEGYIKTKDIYENDVYTRTTFITMKNFFEGYFEKTKDLVNIINATEGGLNIRFARNERLEDVIRNYNFEPREIDEQIKLIYQNSRFPEDTDEKLLEYKEFIESEIIKLEWHCKQQLKLVDLINRDVYHPSKDKRAFDKIVNQVGDLTDRVIESPVYNALLKNIVEIDFFLVKLEVDRVIKELNNYHDIKEVYVNAIKDQNKMLVEKINQIKGFLKDS